MLDTNIIVSDYQLRSVDLRVLAQSLDYTGYQLYLPQVVIDEVVAKYRESVREELEAVRKARENLQRITGNEEVEFFAVTNVNTLTDAYQGRFLEILNELRFNICSYPSVSHSDVVRRVLDDRRPFLTRKEKGYRDTLIWETVLELAASSEKELAFITDDNGFRNKDDLHEHLTHDLIALGIEPGRIHLVRNVKEFNESFLANLRSIDPETVDDLLFELQMSRHQWSDLWWESVRKLDSILAVRPLDLGMFEIPEDVEDLRFMAVEDIESSDIDRLTALPSGEFLIAGWADVRCSFEFERMHDYIYGKFDEYWFDAVLRVEFELTLDPKSSSITSDIGIKSISRKAQGNTNGPDQDLDHLDLD